MKHNNSIILKGYIFAIFSAVIYGCMPLMAKYIYDDGVNPFTLVFLRNFFSLIPLALLALREKKSLRIDAKSLPMISLISFLGCCITPILLFTSYRFIPSGTATVFHFAYPAFVVIGSAIFSKDKPKIHNYLCVIMCIFGISLFYSPDQPLNLSGSLLSLSSAITFAAYVIILTTFKKITGFIFAFYVTVASSFFSLIICLCTNSLSFPSTVSGWALCILFSLLVTTCAVVLFQQSTFLIGGSRASILSTLEPITSIIIGVVVFNEVLRFTVIISAILVIGASILTAVFDIIKSKRT